jgi:octaprenyl-diphosphate synthase
LIGLLDKHGGLAYTQQVAAAYIDKAKQALAIFESSQTKDIMLDIADYALARRQ